MAHIVGSGNCNVSYVTQLSQYYPYVIFDAKNKRKKAQEPHRMQQGLFNALSEPAYTQWGRNTNTEITYNNRRFSTVLPGIFLFAQGSEEPEVGPYARPYARVFAKLIKQYKLGKVHRIPATPNPRHGGKKGVLYVWRIDHAACKQWWENEVDRLKAAKVAATVSE